MPSKWRARRATSRQLLRRLGYTRYCEYKGFAPSNGLDYIARHAKEACYRQFMTAHRTPDTVYKWTEKLIQVFDSIPELSYSLILDTALRVGRARLTRADLYLEFLDRLSQSDSQRIQSVGVLARLLFQIRDQETYDETMRELNAILNELDLTEAERQHVLDDGKGRLDLGKSLARSQELRASGGAVPMDRIMVPELRRVDQTPQWQPSAIGDRQYRGDWRQLCASDSRGGLRH